MASVEAEISACAQKLKRQPKDEYTRRQARRLLKKRRQLLDNLENLERRRDHLEEVGQMSRNMEDVMATVETLKTTNKALKQQYGKIDIDKIEQLQDEMADLMELGNEINESISQAYGVPDEIDEADLEAELEALSEDYLHEQQISMNETPAYLQEEVPPTFVDAPPEQSQVKEAAGGIG